MWRCCSRNTDYWNASFGRSIPFYSLSVCLPIPSSTVYCRHAQSSRRAPARRGEVSTLNLVHELVPATAIKFRLKLLHLGFWEFGNETWNLGELCVMATRNCSLVVSFISGRCIFSFFSRYTCFAWFFGDFNPPWRTHAVFIFPHHFPNPKTKMPNDSRAEFFFPRVPKDLTKIF